MLPRQIIRTGVDGSTPISTQINRRIRETSTPSFSDITGTRITIGVSGTSTDTPAGDLWIPGIGNKWQSSTPNLRYSNKLDASIDRKFTNNPVAPPIFTEVFIEKISNSPRQDIYECIWMQLATDTISPVTPQLVDHGFSTVDALHKGTGLWSNANRIRRSTDVAYWSATDHAA